MCSAGRYIIVVNIIINPKPTITILNGQYNILLIITYILSIIRIFTEQVQLPPFTVYKSSQVKIGKINSKSLIND